MQNGTSGLVECIALMGGIEQGVLLPSGSLLIGIRNKKGIECGFGPNLSLAGVAFVIVVGKNFQTENINFPINLAIIPSSDGIRLSLLSGFNVRRR